MFYLKILRQPDNPTNIIIYNENVFNLPVTIT